MLNTSSILNQVLGSLNSAAGSGGVKGLADKAKATWDGQSPAAKGAIAGGLLSLILTQGGRRILGSGVQIGGMAAIGGLAYKAYTDWKAGRSATAETGKTEVLAAPDGTPFAPTETSAANALAGHLLQAMIAAAKVDGHVTAEERARIDAELPRLGLGDAAEAMIAAELDAPVDAARIAALAGSEEEATQIYAASRLVADPDTPEETAYLDALARALKLPADLVAHLDARAAALV
jgi:uncharacterized membrane protein YebE (DUF533 family)